MGSWFCEGCEGLPFGGDSSTLTEPGIWGSFRFYFATRMLSDREAEEIERQLGRGVRSGPLVLSWVNKLLADRKERVGQIHHVRQRLNQAFRYLDRLLRDLPVAPPTAPKSGLTCGRCGQPFDKGPSG